MKYKRILLKLSGEALMGDKNYGIDSNLLEKYSSQIKKLHGSGIEIAIVIGGGNIYRGIEAEESGINRVQGDYMGMLATLINSMALQSHLEKLECDTRLMSGFNIDQVCEPFIRRRAIRHLEKGRVVVFGGGCGNPFFTTDTTAALRAAEINAEAVMKATKVDGVYDKDPNKFNDATKFTQLTYQQVLSDEIAVMDSTAIALCKDNNIPILVFDIFKKGNISKAAAGDSIGSLIS
ncbi:MAG: UMP kinase [Flavobacteriales bacterium]|nr:UMP kinase [Flavobacteriales bacterium]